MLIFLFLLARKGKNFAWEPKKNESPFPFLPPFLHVRCKK